MQEVHLENNEFIEVTHAGEFESIVERERDVRDQLKREGKFGLLGAMEGSVLTKKGASEDDAYADILLAKQKRIHQRMRIKQRQFEAREKERARSRESEISGATADEEEVDNGAMGVVEVPLHLRKVEGYPDSVHVRQRALVDEDSTAAEAETAGLTKVCVCVFGGAF